MPGRSRTNTTTQHGDEALEHLDTSSFHSASRPTSPEALPRQRNISSGSQTESVQSFLHTSIMPGTSSEVNENTMSALPKRAAKEKAGPLVVHTATLQSASAAAQSVTARPSIGIPHWSKPLLTGRIPSHGFRAHTTTLIGHELFLFGGCNKNQCFRDMWKLNLQTRQWFKPKIHGALIPPLCRAHTATAVGDKIYIIGGGEGGTYFDTVWVFDTEYNEWSKPALFGPIPSARRAHAAVLWKKQIVIMGGGNGTKALNGKLITI